VFAGEVLGELCGDYDTAAVALSPDLTLVWMDHIYTEHWAHRLGIGGQLALPAAIEDRMLMPDDAVIAELVRCLTAETSPRFAVIWTDYFGGVGDQRAATYRGDELIETDGTINGALRGLGVIAASGLDEFDTVGLGDYRSIPDALLERWERYPDY
jgi:hypothetical protein